MVYLQQGLRRQWAISKFSLWTLKPRVDQNTTLDACVQDLFFYFRFLLSQSIQLHFLHSLSPFFSPALNVANAGSCVHKLNKMGHPAHHCKWLMQVCLSGACGIETGSKTFTFFIRTFVTICQGWQHFHFIHIPAVLWSHVCLCVLAAVFSNNIWH